jgi:uncharacterized protein YjiK
MRIGSGLAFLAGLVACVGSCRDTPRAKAEQVKAIEAERTQQLARRIVMADANPAQAVPLAKWTLPPDLREISGLTMTTDGRMLAHDDERGRVYQIDPKTGIVLKSFALKGDPIGDFEGITTAGPDIYLLRSDGTLFKFSEGADGEEVSYSQHDTRLGRDCEFEGVAFESDSSWLLLACKRVKAKSLRDQLVIYRVQLPLTDASQASTLTIPLTEVIGSNRWKNFNPSDIAIDPTTGNYVLVSSQEKGIVVITPDGQVVRAEPLPEGHSQAEGVAVTRDSILIVSDEATQKPAAITLYRWRP